MTELKTGELKEILSWIIGHIESAHGNSLKIESDFYRIPESLSWFFDLQFKADAEVYGSFADEIDLLRRSVLAGSDDLPGVVMERAAYILLYLAYRTERPIAAPPERSH